MGSVACFSSFNLRFRFFLFLIITLILIIPCIVAEEANDGRATPPPSSNFDDGGGTGGVAAIAIGNPPSPPPPKPSAFKPGIAVVVGVLTTMFSLTFLLLLYIKHRNNGGNADTISGNPSSRLGVQFVSGRKNSGIDRAVVESLPIFRFGSLTGQKEGLDCAVCLTKFEVTEVLRLLPKCKHAFHVECVDTWLDAHSTCPLCRYRVDPEDILLLQHNDGDNNNNNNNEQQPELDSAIEIKGRNHSSPNPITEIRRVSGRHSSVGEREGGLLQIILQKGATNADESMNPNTTTSFRRSLDSAIASNKKKSENVVGIGVGVGCFVRARKDGMLLSHDTDRDRTSVERRLEHRIIVSPSPKSNGGVHNQQQQQQRWSDVHPSDLLYLTSEMIISDGRGFSQRRNMHLNTEEGLGGGSGRGVINKRSVSEITGLSRFLSNNNNINNNHNNDRNRNREGCWHRYHEEEEREREERLVSRWLAWISKSQTRPALR